MTASDYALFGIENPLLDISAVVKEELLAEYGLKANDAILAEDKHKSLYTKLVNEYPVEYIAGGAAQNSCRGAQWLMPPNSTVYVGCVGNDKNAEKLRTFCCSLLNDLGGLETHYKQFLTKNNRRGCQEGWSSNRVPC
jgi:adenosine kinase